MDLYRLNKLGLGTAQWGLNYGISNSFGRPTDEEVAHILDHARSAGICLLDTAHMYGNAESRIGILDTQGMQLVTKMPALAQAARPGLRGFMESSFKSSLESLKVDRVYGYLAHRSDDIIGKDGKEVQEFLAELRDSGKADKVGVSVYEAYEIREVLQVFKPDIVQLPLNILDQRLLHDGTLAELKLSGVEVHVRSVFLQGLLLLDLDRIPNYFKPILPLLSKWHAMAAEQGLTLLGASLSFVRDIAEVDKIIVGVESLAQLLEITRSYKTPVTMDSSGLAIDDPKWLDPRRWITL